MTEQQKKQSSVEAAMQDRLVKAAWQALEALNEVTGWQWAGPMRVMDEVEDAITALTAALEQPKQKCNYPYCGCDSKAWCKVERNAALDKKAENAREIGLDYEPVIDKSAAIRIATALGWEPKRQPLTDEQISKIDWKQNETLHDFARAIERAHGIKGDA